MEFEKVVTEQIEKAISTPFATCLLSDGIKALLKEHIKEYKERVAPKITRRPTGVFDDNRKAILEGDIVCDYAYIDCGGTGIVCWSERDGEFYVSIPNDRDRGLEIDGMVWRVIGNIYDNPELLADKT